MKIRNTDLRLKPGDCSSFFKSNPKLYVELREGKVVTIPEEFEEEVLEIFGLSIEVVKEKKKPKTLSIVDEGTNNE